MSAREEILTRVRKALADRETHAHPGDFGSWQAEPSGSSVPAFTEAFISTGGEVVRVADEAQAGAWLREFSADFSATAIGDGVPVGLRPPLATAPPAAAELGVSMATSGVAETGSLVLGAPDGRRTQLLPPTHVVFLHTSDTFATLKEALTAMKGTLPSAIGLHSGPSKSADIGQVLVRGVHGPGRVIAVLIGADQ